MWNGADPILKERMFGLTNGQGNHGEDVKEYWFYLDSTPTHSYMKSLYKYPQREFPYADLVSTNAARSRDEFEYELIDTGIFADDRYFDVFCEYAKAAPDDILVELTAHNRGPDRATLELLPTLWFRNTWAWSSGGSRAVARAHCARRCRQRARHASRARRVAALLRGVGAELLFCENETNNERVFGTPNVAAHVKDGINDHVVDGVGDAVNPEGRGTKVSARHELVLEPGAHARVRLRLVAASGRAGRRRAPRRRLRPGAAGAAHGSGRVLRDGDRTDPRCGRRPTWRARRSPACSGASSTTSTTCTAGSASTASTPGPRRAATPACATSRGPTSTRAT